MCDLATATEYEELKNNCKYAKMDFKEERQTMNQEEKEYDLLKRSCQGDSQAMEAIYLHHKQSIFNLVYRHTYNPAVAEDLLQDIFLKVFTHLKDIQKKETFVGWLYRIAINTCYSYLRTKKSPLQKTIPLNEVEGKLHGKTNDSQEMMIKKPLDNAIENLPHKLKSVFLLHDVQGFKHEEISRTLGCSVGTSKSQLFKARKKIRDYLKNKQVL